MASLPPCDRGRCWLWPEFFTLQALHTEAQGRRSCGASWKKEDSFTPQALHKMLNHVGGSLSETRRDDIA